MCSTCLFYAGAVAVCAALFALLVGSAFWQQFQNPRLLASLWWSGELFLKYAAGFFFLLLAKWKFHKLREMHEKKRR